MLMRYLEIHEPGTLELNAGRAAKRSWLPILATAYQVGSHYHFFESKSSLQFDRAETFGFRLDIPAGTAIRFELGDTKEVTLVAIAEERHVYGLNSLVNGASTRPVPRQRRWKRCRLLLHGTMGGHLMRINRDRYAELFGYYRRPDSTGWYLLNCRSGRDTTVYSATNVFWWVNTPGWTGSSTWCYCRWWALDLVITMWC